MRRWLNRIEKRLRDRPPRHVHFWLVANERYVGQRTGEALHVEFCGGCPARRLPPGQAVWR